MPKDEIVSVSTPLLPHFPNTELQGNRKWLSNPNFRLCLVFSVAFFLAFTAWHPLQNLETTIAPGHGSGGQVSGRVSLGIVYGANVAAAGTFAPVVVRRIGAKFCMLFQFCAFAIYLAATMWQAPYTVYPASLLVGAGSAMLWVAEGDFITQIAMDYDAQDATSTSVIGTFNGIFFTAFALTQVVGNLISSAVLSVYGRADGTSDDENDVASGTTRTGEHVLYAVFAGFLALAILVTALIIPRHTSSHIRSPVQNRILNSTTDDQHDKSIHPGVVQGTPTASVPSGIASAEEAARLVPSRGAGDTAQLMSSRSWTRAIAQQVRECAELATQPRWFMLAPIVAANGLDGAFIFGDLSSQILQPVVGDNQIGTAMSVFGSTNAVTSLVIGRLSDSYGRAVPLATGTLIFVVALAAPLVIDINTHVGVYLLAAAVGVGNGVMFTLVYASVSAAFPDCPSSAYGIKSICENLACATYFFVSGYLSLHTKLVGGIALNLFGLVCYLSTQCQRARNSVV